MLLVYTHKITPRLTYTFNHIFKRVLLLEVNYTSKVEDFIAHDSIKMSYSKKPLSNEFHVKSHDLLFDQGLSDFDIKVQNWEETKGFFPTNERSDLPFDIFAASFFLLSRYEEYWPHVSDDFGRFMASESLAFQNGFLEQPVVDIWALKLKTKLQLQFPSYIFPKKRYQIIPVIDVPIAYYFKHKGLLRSFGGYASDILRFKFFQLYQRFLVMSGFRRDPYDSFKWIVKRQKAAETKFQFFFLIGDYSTYDKNISPNKKIFVSLIKSIADYCDVGLKASYNSLEDPLQLKRDKDRMERITHREVIAVRNSYSKLNLPTTYRNLNDLEIRKDFTMGYVNHIGFRAGSCTPFLFYDLDYEIQTPLQVVPYHCMDFALLKLKSQLDRKQLIDRIVNVIKGVDGTFVTVFHNYSLGSEARWTGFREMFNQIIDSVET
ncbi:polysaccharide deacetylase family protein [Winogradskyella aurantiaca]|uniref:polysaccharide deacetylase family protein n=1 Tax=Winogradskyella aurantiaca TaxID=2219558 RepID=UPI000E1D99EA|nr:polysaccharide deacetylase family protein [Winogradskyella aurantiaca]